MRDLHTLRALGDAAAEHAETATSPGDRALLGFEEAYWAGVEDAIRWACGDAKVDHLDHALAGTLQEHIDALYPAEDD